MRSGKFNRAEINLLNLRHNITEFRNFLPAGTDIMAVVKADAYGHGAEEIARESLQAGVAWLGVAMVEEGVSLRKAGINCPILVFQSPLDEEIELLFEYRLTPTVFTLHLADKLSREAVNRQAVLPVHVKVDTGMGRLGVFPADDALPFIVNLKDLPGIKAEGLYTHFACADEEDRSFTDLQLKRFLAVIRKLAEAGLCPPLVHAANSAAILEFPGSWFNLVRLGISLYGHYPSAAVRRKIALKPLLTLKSRIAYVKEVPAGTPLSYGSTFVATEKARIATVPFGYADGYNRLLSNRGEVLVRGQRAPVVGKICMDQFLIRVDHIGGVEEGDEVVIYGTQGREEISVEEVAETLGTISYEVLCNISKRVPRVYYKG
ncbi:MAG TPA: alanine racemase [Firmicutes bacterium]|nr:alanine racemase [Bacillota bacterium]